MKIDEKQIVEVMEKHIDGVRTGPEIIFHFIPVGKIESVAAEIIALFKSHTHFTRAELEDLERLTAGTSLDWCQRLNAKFEKALGIKEVKDEAI